MPDERVLATACASLALEVLGARGRELAQAQLALVRKVGRNEAAAVPFFSAASCSALGERARRHAVTDLLHDRSAVGIAGDVYALTVYEDTAGAVRSGLVALALSRPGDLCADGRHCPRVGLHPRYRCRLRQEYVGHFALAAAVSEGTPGSPG